MDGESMAAALLHDVVEDTDMTKENIQEEFGEDVANLVEGVTKLGKVPIFTKEEQQAENVRKMLMAMSQDIRVIIIKLADRIHNMRTLSFMRPDKRREKLRKHLKYMLRSLTVSVSEALRRSLRILQSAILIPLLIRRSETGSNSSSQRERNTLTVFRKKSARE